MSDTHKNSANVNCIWAIGLLFAEGVRFVTRLERYPSKNFYWETGKKSHYFENKSVADDCAFGMLVNGYPAVVMEVPESLILKNPDNEGAEEDNEKE